jgi:FAD-dependent urate hydroxylase
MKILIVGAGIGGLTLASFLKDSAIDFDIVERSKNLDLQGFSIGLWNNGRHILSKLGLAEKFDKEGSKIHHYKICDGKGKILKDFDLHDFYSSYGIGYTHISRASIHSWLLDIVGREKIQLDSHILAIKDTGKEVEVEFQTGEKKIYDLVAGGDGIHSQVRKLVFGGEYEVFDNWRVWYAWINNNFKEKGTVSEYIEPGEFIGVFDAGDKTLAVLVAPADHSVWDDVQGRMLRLKNTFRDESKLSGFLDNLKDEDIMPTDFSHIKMKRLFKGKVVLLGDAAHGFESYAGLGASMAMEDGYVLAGELLQVSENYKLKQALLKYQAVRKRRVALARSLTNRMRIWASIKSKCLRKLVNLLIPLVPETFITRPFHSLLKEEI